MNNISGWWCNNHIEKWWSSSMGRVTVSHIYQTVWSSFIPIFIGSIPHVSRIQAPILQMPSDCWHGTAPAFAGPSPWRGQNLPWRRRPTRKMMDFAGKNMDLFRGDTTKKIWTLWLYGLWSIQNGEILYDELRQKWILDLTHRDWNLGV